MGETFKPFRPTGIKLDLQGENTPGKAEMLDGLVDINGQRIGNYIDRLLTDESRLVIAGSPGAGKTTLLSQVDYSLRYWARKFCIPVKIATILYDNSLRNAGRLGKAADTPEFNRGLVQRILNPRKWTTVYAQEGLAEKGIVLAEIPAVGKTEPKDRGVSAFEELARNSQDTLFLYVVAHPFSQLNGLAARFTASVFSADRVVKALKDLHNIVIEAPDIEDEEVLGRMVKSAVRWTAKGIHVKTILYEMADQFFQWRHLDRESFEKNTEEIILPESYNPSRVMEQLMTEDALFLDPEDINFREELRGKARIRASLPRMEAAYAQHRFRELGIPEERGIIAFNPFRTGPIRLYIRP